MIKKGLLGLSLLFSLSTQASPPTLHSEIIIQDTLAALPHCSHYHMPIHVCVWLSDWGEINTTPLLDHYLPDLVVSVFRKPHGNPWVEINKVIDNAGEPIQKGIIKAATGFPVGHGNHSLVDAHEEAVIFKEADVIGNPALSVIPKDGALPSTATPWQPYFQSLTDSVLWRGLPPAALAEEAMALALNVAHHIGTGVANWGGIYPHEGKVIGENDLQASIVIAARAADLTTSLNGYGHIYHRLSTHCGEECTATPIQENSPDTYFQMIYPKTETDCHVLGDSDSSPAHSLTTEGAYVWIVWRHYIGCADGKGHYIGKL
jgi:integrating conjugative element protein (TIGR03756 family)